MNEQRKGHLAVLAANIIFAANFSVVKFITPSLIKPFALNVVRVVVSVALFWIMYFLKPSTIGIQKKHISRFLVCAATGVALNQMLFIKGISLTTSIHGALLMLGSPIFITFIAAWLLKERLGLTKILGLVIGVGGGVLLISMKETSGTGSNIILGDILVLVNAISYAFYLVLVRPLMKEYTPIHVMRWVFTFGMFMILPFGLHETAGVNWQAFNSASWISLSFVVIGATFFAYLFNIYGVNVIGPSATGAYIYTQPVFATIVAMAFLGEHITTPKILAGLLIFAGVFLVNYKSKAPGQPA
ncbi:MAG: putative superfamily transporter inner rane protein [Segetibacter sp.]|nr:putative superfamily transporter inner rane protein [Segetibacter sp.]